jgi:hypothetical protein
MDYLVTVMYPEHSERTVNGEALPAAYAALKGTEANVSWGQEGSDSLILQVADDYCVITGTFDGGYYYLQTSDDDELVPVLMGDVDAEVPKGAIVPRELGLEVLLRVDDLPALRTDYMWVEAG